MAMATDPLSVVPGRVNVAGAAPAVATPSAVTPGASGGLATVDISSKRPRDVQSATPVPNTVTTGAGTAAEPVIPMQNKPATAVPGTRMSPPSTAALTPRSSKVVAAAPAAVVPATPSAAGSVHGSYTLNLSAYASATGAASLATRVRGLGYPVSSHVTSQAGKPRTLVIAGPFDTRAGAAAAGVKSNQVADYVGVSRTSLEDAGSQGTLAPGASPTVAAARPVVAATPAAKPATPVAAAGRYCGALRLHIAAIHQCRRIKLGAGSRVRRPHAVRWGSLSDGRKVYRWTLRNAQDMRDQIKAKLGIDGNVVSTP
ncbi:MAG: hypothetical protein WDW38_006422 [Sanguina aurantia]